MTCPVVVVFHRRPLDVARSRSFTARKGGNEVVSGVVDAAGCLPGIPQAVVVVVSAEDAGGGEVVNEIKDRK